MTTLHTIARSWHGAQWLFEQMAFAAEGDAILLLQDAVLAAHSDLTLASFLAKCQAAGIDVFVLQDDLRLRGVENKYPRLQPVDYTGFVELTQQHQGFVAW